MSEKCTRKCRHRKQGQPDYCELTGRNIKEYDPEDECVNEESEE